MQSEHQIGTGSSKLPITLGKMSGLENEKKTAFSQYWCHKKEKPYEILVCGKLPEDVGLELIEQY